MKDKTEVEKYYEKDEIDLVDYIKIIFKRKLVILTTVFFLVIITAIRIYWGSISYETTAIVKIGSISGSPVMTKIDAFYEIRKKEKFDLVVKTLKLDFNLDEFNKVISTEDIADSGLIKVRVKYKHSEFARKICNLIADSFVFENNELLDKRVILLEERIRKLEASRFVADRERVFQLKQEVLGIKRFEVIQSAMISKLPVLWDVVSKFIFPITFGLTFGIFLVLFMESSEKYKHGRD